MYYFHQLTYGIPKRLNSSMPEKQKHRKLNKVRQEEVNYFFGKSIIDDNIEHAKHK